MRFAISEKDGVPLVAPRSSTNTTRKTRSDSKPCTIPDLDFADDIIILSPTLHQARATLHRLEEAALSIGLTISSGKGKTEYFTRSKICDAERIFTLPLADGRPVPKVSQYKYLGTNVLNPQADSNSRVNLAWKMFVILNRNLE